MMTKNTFLTLVIAATAFSAQSQISSKMPEYPKSASPVVKMNHDGLGSQKLAKKGGFSGSGWYNYVNDLGTGGETFAYFGDVTLWPDSLPVIVYTDGPQHAYLSGIGQVFDPTSEWYQDPSAPQLTGFNRYSIDSIAFRYKYRHVVPGSVDTLVIDFFNDDKLVNFTFTGGGTAKSPKYIPSANRSSDITSTTKILLDENNNDPEFFYPKSSSYASIMNVALPATMQVKGGGKMAFVVTYKPGVAYKMNDTLVTGRDSINLPKKLLNSFQPYFLEAQTGVPDDAHNYALAAYKSQRYSTRTSEWYYPNNAPSAKRRHMYAFYKLTYYNLSTKDVNNQGYGLGSVYPNPVKAGNDVTIDFALGKGENVNIQLFNVLGSKVADVASDKFAAGNNSVTFNTSNLAPGVYVYTINAGGFKASKKFTVIN